jgi:hypothetical protein
MYRTSRRFLMVTLTRYEIHVNGKFLQGAVLAGTYSQEDWETVCTQAGVDPEEAELWIDGYNPNGSEADEFYDLAYPSLPDAEYLFWFTPEGDEEFRKFYGHLLAEAMALAKGGEVIVLQRKYNPEDVIYEDKDQVVYLR